MIGSYSDMSSHCQAGDVVTRELQLPSYLEWKYERERPKVVEVVTASFESSLVPLSQMPNERLDDRLERHKTFAIFSLCPFA